MTVIRKTYAARGLLDFKMALNVGGAIIRLCFSGGGMGSNGIIPAKYTTDNPAIMSLIEKSPQFESKRVYLFKHETLKEKDAQDAGKGTGKRGRPPKERSLPEEDPDLENNDVVDLC